MPHGAYYAVTSGTTKSARSHQLQTRGRVWTACRTLSIAAALAAVCIGSAAIAQGAKLRLDDEIASASQIAGPAPAQIGTAAALTLGPGDVVAMQVYGRPELSSTIYVGDDGTIQIPLAGAVKVSGLSPAQASQRVADALKEGNILVNPQVSIILSQFRSQQVSVLGDVRTPARFPIESRTTVLDLLALAGGVNDSGGNVIYVIRPDNNGHVSRYPIDLKGLSDSKSAIPTLTLRGGDTVFVPRAEQFYIYGEVTTPNMYRIEPGMTVLQAMARGGGVTPRGSDSRVEIRRRIANDRYVTITPELTDPVMPNDVIRVKQRIF